jgi:hypothetical protein
MKYLEKRPHWWFYLVLIAIVAVPLVLLVIEAKKRLPILFTDHGNAISRLAIEMTKEEKDEFYRYLANQIGGGFFEPVPEPLVGRVLKTGIIRMYAGAEVVSNNAGMRSKRPFKKKAKDVYRIICLGDSFVFSHGKEEDRFGDQIEEILHGMGVTVDGKEIEVYSVGLGSWTALNEATYLTSRLSEYDPDLIMILMLNNDLSDTQGVNGIGVITNAFSPEYRRYGSGIFSNAIPLYFGVRLVNLLGYKTTFNLLRFDLGPESRARWEKSFAAWKRLETLQEERGGRMLFGVLEAHPFDVGYFTELSLYYHRLYEMKSPFVRVCFPLKRKYTLPHDPHPNRAGYGLLVSIYLRALARLNWLNIDENVLPPLPQAYKLLIEREPDVGFITKKREEIADRCLKKGYVFNDLEPEDTLSFLGGIWPGSSTYRLDALKIYPYGMLKSAFLLKRDPGARYIVLTVEVPPYPELYPFKLEMYLHGNLSHTLELTSRREAGRHILKGEIPSLDENEVAIEVKLRTDSYYTQIEDPVMKSYRLISVRQE